MRRARRRRAPAAQRRVLRRLLPGCVPQAGRARDRRPRHVRSRRPGPRGGLRRQGLAGAVGRPARRRLPGRRSVPGARDRGRTRIGPTIARWPSRRHAARRSARSTSPPSTASTSPSRGARVALLVRGLRSVEAVRLQPRGARGRVRRRRNGTQPRRRGGDAARQHAALERRVHRPPGAGPARGGRDRAQGQAAASPVGARDRRLRVPARDRLRGGGVPARRRQHAAALQGVR